LRSSVADLSGELEFKLRVLDPMDYGVGIAGLSLICGLLAVFASVIAVGLVLQRIKGPDDRGFSH